MYGTELHAEQKPVEDSIRAGGVPGAGQCIHTQQDR